MSTHYTLKSILVPLTKNQIAYIDPIDTDLARLKWCAHFCPSYSNGGAYWAKRAARINGKPRQVLMHRVVLERMLERELVKGEVVDHINGDPLDNHRANLRVATRAENRRNSAKHRDNKSGFKGVHKDGNKWRAEITVDYERIYLGAFYTPEEAYQAYCTAAKNHHGKYARLK